MLVNTCAVRDNAEQRVIGRMGELQRYKRPGDVLGVVGCMAQRLGPTLLERVPQVDLVVGPDAYRNLPALIARGRRRRAGERHRVPRLGALRGRARRCARPGPTRVRHGAARLRLSVHLLHRSEHARAGAEPQLEDVVREVAALAEQRHHRGHAPWADGQQLSRRHARLRRPAARGRRGGRHPAAPVHQPVSHRLHRPGHRGDGRRRRRCASTCTCRCRAARTRCSGGCCGATPASAISRWWRELRGGDSRASPSRPTSSSASPGETEAQFEETLSPGGRGRLRRRLHLQVLGARGHAGGAARRITSPTRWRRSGWSGSSRWCARRPGARTWRGSAQMHEVLVERPARRGDLHAGPHPHQSSGPGGPARRARSASTIRSGSPARRVPPSPGRCVAPALAVL